MFEETISKQSSKNLALLGSSKILNNAYLAGGTALALQLGHRISYDLDFFTEKKFKAQIFLKKISQFKDYRHERVGWRTILGKLGDVKFSLFYYSYPLLKKPVKFNEYKTFYKQMIENITGNNLNIIIKDKNKKVDNKRIVKYCMNENLIKDFYYISLRNGEEHNYDYNFFEKFNVYKPNDYKKYCFCSQNNI